MPCVIISNMVMVSLYVIQAKATCFANVSHYKCCCAFMFLESMGQVTLLVALWCVIQSVGISPFVISHQFECRDIRGTLDENKNAEYF